MSYDDNNKIGAPSLSMVDRFQAALSGLGSGDTSVGEVGEQNKYKNVALFATHMQPPAVNNGSVWGYGTASGSQDTGASNI